MFGYLNIQKQKLEKGQQGLWQAFMCGLCFSTKKHFSNKARLFVNNDITFFDVLFHSFLGVEVEVVEKTCVSHPIKKRSMLNTTPLSDKLSIANNILIYFNLLDDVLDGSGIKKKLAYMSAKKDFQKAKTLWPEFSDCVEKNYQQLRQLEKGKTDSLDKVCHPFASLSQQFCKLILGENFNDTIGQLCYNVGKWVYLIDALDDIKHDLSKGDYNAFVDYYGGVDASFVTEKYDEIEFFLFAVLNGVAICYNDLNLTKYKCILDNVLHVSMRNKTKEILSKYKK